MAKKTLKNQIWIKIKNANCDKAKKSNSEEKTFNSLLVRTA